MPIPEIWNTGLRITSRETTNPLNVRSSCLTNFERERIEALGIRTPDFLKQFRSGAWRIVRIFSENTVESRGFEPLTSAMPLRRSTN